MFIVAIISFFAFYLSILDSTKILKNGLGYAFLLISIIAAIRYDYGTDYMSYMLDFKRVNRYSIPYIIEYQEQLQYADSLFKDIGGVILFKIFHPFGFFVFVAFVSMLSNYIYYQFIRENVARKYYWLAFFFYAFQFEFYALQMSMIRQGLVISLFVWAWHFIRRNKYIIPIIITLICISIHKTSIVLIPFLFIKHISLKNNKLIASTLVCMLVLAFASSVLINTIFDSISQLPFLAIYFESYGQDEGGQMGIIRLLLTFIPFILGSYYLWKGDNDNNKKALVLLSCIGTLFIPFTNIAQLISRLAYYFNIFQIASIPLCVSKLNGYIRLGIITILILATVYQYYDIFTNSVYTPKFIEYQTIFTAP